MPQYRGTPGPKRGSGWVGEWGGGMGDFWDRIRNVNEENMKNIEKKLEHCLHDPCVASIELLPSVPFSILFY